MTADLRPYPEYQDSGLPWLGQVPAHWEEKRAKYYFREVDERSTTGAEQLMSVSHKTGVTPRKSTVTMFMAESNVGYKTCRPGDIVINTMWAWMAAMGVARQTGVVSPSYGVYRPRNASFYLPDFIDHLLRTRPYVSEYICRSTGIRASRLRLYPEDFLDIPIVCPPPEEQEAIVRFIAHHDRLVRRFIRNRRGLIEVLNEQKQAIINRAVTRGLDPNVPLKPSGIEWLGDMPEHWMVKPLKRWVSINELVLPESTDPDYTFQYLEIGCVGTGLLVEKPVQLRFGDAPSRARRVLRIGDTIISTVRTYLRAVYFVADNADDLVASTGFAALTPGPGIMPEFLGIALRSAPFIDRVTAHSIGIAYPAISETRLGAFPVAIPPSIDEQAAIVAYVRCETEVLDKGILRAQREIDLIREYRTRLIADVVTGKVDVRHVASDILAKTASVAVCKPVDAGRAANIHFKRSVFAAEIVHRLHDEPTFGHVKFQKLFFLCEKQCGVDTGSTYYRQAAGPYDNRALRSIDSQMKKQQWYAAQKVDKRYWYVPLAKAGGHKTYFDRYFADVEDEFTKVIEMLRKADSEQSEIVATLYSAWENLLGSGEQVMEDRIIEEVLHHWHPSKQRIDEGRWRRALGWMKEKGLVPRMTGSAEAEDLECLETDEYIDEEMPEDDDEVAEEVTDADD